MQDAVMGRLNLTTTEARTRVKMSLNLRYAEVCSGVGLAKTRRSTITQATTANNNAITFTSTANLFSIFDAVHLKRPLQEISIPELRALDAAAAVTGYPHSYAINTHGKTTVAVLLYPKPTTVYNLSADILATGTAMSANGDEPTFPVDFHDLLVDGALEWEYDKMEKAQHLATKAGRRFEKRVSELRYFYAKRAFLKRVPQDLGSLGLSEKIWPIGVAP
jgi:hypothetical protein